MHLYQAVQFVICYLLKIKSKTVFIARFMNDLVPNKVPGMLASVDANINEKY